MEKYLILLVLLLTVAGCTAIPQTLTVNHNPVSSGKPSSPLDMSLQATTLDNGEMDITVTLSMPPADQTNLTAEGVKMDILVPEQFQIVEGKPGINSIDIKPGEIVTRTIRVKNVKDGEGVIRATSVTAHNENESYFGDNEDIYFYAQDGKVRLSQSPFTSSGSQSEAVQLPNQPTQSDATPNPEGIQKKRE